MLGLSIDKIVVLLIVAVFVIGPERMPKYAAQLARLVRSLRGMAEGAKDRLRDEMGPDFDDVDWKKLDPRQYDPRRIIRSALLDDSPGEALAAPVVGIVKREVEPVAVAAVAGEQALDAAPGSVSHGAAESETNAAPAAAAAADSTQLPVEDAVSNAFRGTQG